MPRTFALACLTLPTLLLAAGCGGEPVALDPGGSPGIVRQVKEDPSFESDIQEIFEREGCAAGACHGVGASAGLNLERGFAYANLVGIAATQEGFERVTGGKASESYLVIKLEGRQQVGTRMPPTGNPLDAIDLGNIKNWINQGAKNN